MPVEQLVDRNELRDFLTKDRIANAYLLGDLDPAYFQFCSWYGSRHSNGELCSILLIYKGLSLPAVFVVGHATDCRNFLEEAKPLLPERFHFHVREHQMQNVRDVFEIQSCKPMYRMGLERSNFSPAQKSEKVVRLGHRDTAQIMALYEHFPDHFFEPYQLETGLYFGIRDPQLELSSIAGIHVISEEHDVAVIGNLVTHPDARGRGLATQCTNRLLMELFERVSFVALNVQQDNAPAIQMYKNFGFQANNIFFEGQTTLS